MPIRSLGPVWAAAAALACAPPAAPPVPARDGGRTDPPDARPPRLRIDAGRDGGPVDGSLGDGAAIDDAGDVGDGGRTRLPVIDGVVADDEWAGALLVESPTPPRDGLSLRRMRVIRTEARLVLAVEGTITPGHAILVYVDADFGGVRGVLLASGAELSDSVGALDRALSQTLFADSATLRIDYAWGSTEQPRALVGADDGIGWRDVASRTSDFQRLRGGEQSACSETACETSIALGSGALEASGEMAIFARIGDADRNLANQTLPFDDPGAPEVVGTVLSVPPPVRP